MSADGSTIADLTSRLPVAEGDHSGQVRMAYRLAAKYTGKLLYVPQVGWHIWDKQRWALDENGAAVRAVLATLRRALAESLNDEALRKDVRNREGSASIRGASWTSPGTCPTSLQPSASSTPTRTCSTSRTGLSTCGPSPCGRTTRLTESRR